MAESWFLRVKNVRNKVNLTQHEFAAKLGVSYQTIVQWERMAIGPYSRLAERFERVEKRVLSGEYTDPWEGLEDV